MDELHRRGVQIRFIGERAAFSRDIRTAWPAPSSTADNRQLTLCIAANYAAAGTSCGRRAAHEKFWPGVWHRRHRRGPLGSFFNLHDLPEPELFIRTGGDLRINFCSGSWRIASCTSPSPVAGFRPCRAATGTGRFRPARTPLRHDFRATDTGTSCMKQRVITALLLAPVVLACILLPPAVLMALIAAALLGGLWNGPAGWYHQPDAAGTDPARPCRRHGLAGLVRLEGTVPVGGVDRCGMVAGGAGV